MDHRANLRRPVQSVDAEAAISGQRTLFSINATIEAVSRTKFPAAFYKGLNYFGPSQTTSKANLNRVVLAASSAAMEDVPASATSDVPEEADIWKISDTTAYFFNQLRGLQVIDLTKPATPALIASVRMPAVGQDLYLLLSDTGRQDVLLVTTEQSADYGKISTLLRVVRVEGGVARIVQTVRAAVTRRAAVCWAADFSSARRIGIPTRPLCPSG